MHRGCPGFVASWVTSPRCATIRHNCSNCSLRATEALGMKELQTDRDCTTEISVSPPRGPWLVEVGGPGGNPRQILRAGQAMGLGGGRSAGMRVEDAAVSGEHAAIRAGHRGLDVVDLDSRNGVYVGSAKVKAASLVSESLSFVIGRSTVTVCSAQQDVDSSSAPQLPGVIGNSEPMRRLARDVFAHARTSAPLLLEGESGSGKDVVARAIHELSGRRGEYVPLNVAAVAESLADSELFGPERGAFTGAVGKRSGAFEQAHRGTLLLDEIADLPMPIQVKLLRVIEDGRIRRVGADSSFVVDTRVVSATWANLEQRVAEERFRGDLFHRISTARIHIPALRTRRSDIPAIAVALLERLAPQIGSKQLNSGALGRLVAHSWPGNVRELSSVLYRAAVAATGSEIQGVHVDAALPITLNADPGDRPSVVDLVKLHGGNVAAAARAARVPRSTFRAWLRKVEADTGLESDDVSAGSLA